MSKWIDISKPLYNEIPVWPGDNPFQYKMIGVRGETGPANVGEVKMNLHTGTHIDAPFHYDHNGKRVDELDINLYIGPARVIHLPDVKSIGIKEVSAWDIKGVTRLLLRTDAWKDQRRFPDFYPPVEPELAEYLSGQGVQLLGLDLPSVDPVDSGTIPAHLALNQVGIHILESLVLEGIEPGDYELAALPLAIVGADGSPVRAVLRKID